MHWKEADSFWLLTLAMAALVIVGAIGVIALLNGIPVRADALLGGMVTGLLLFIREIIQTIRASWQDGKEKRLTDQLGNSEDKA